MNDDFQSMTQIRIHGHPFHAIHGLKTNNAPFRWANAPHAYSPFVHSILLVVVDGCTHFHGIDHATKRGKLLDPSSANHQNDTFVKIPVLGS
jgi:hypothetical protein